MPHFVADVTVALANSSQFFRGRPIAYIKSKNRLFLQRQSLVPQKRHKPATSHTEIFSQTKATRKHSHKKNLSFIFTITNTNKHKDDYRYNHDRR
jgi:hypothetical protein